MLAALSINRVTYLLFLFYYLCTLQEYSEDSNSEPDVDLENQYYNSKALRSDDPKAALTSFQRVLDLEGNDKGEWGFRALKQMIKINFTLVSSLVLLTQLQTLFKDIASIKLSGIAQVDYGSRVCPTVGRHISIILAIIFVLVRKLIEA